MLANSYNASCTFICSIKFSLWEITLMLIAVKVGIANTNVRRDTTKSHILLFAFSINLAKNEFLDVIANYLRFTDKDFFQRKR